MMRRLSFALCSLMVLTLPENAHANDLLFSQATMPVVLYSFAAWFLAGLLIVAWKGREFSFLGYGSLCAFLVCTFGLFGHPEIALTVWMPYVGLLTVYYLFPREGVPPGSRLLNLLFHGSFLLLLIVGGGIAKFAYWSNLGGFTGWSRSVQNVLPSFLALYSVVLALLFSRFYHAIVKRHREQMKVMSSQDIK